MTVILRRLARPMLAGIFIYGGINAFKQAEGHAEAARPVLDKVGERSDKLPDAVPTDPVTLVKIDAGVKIAAGTLLALNKFPRLSSLALIGSLVPTTLAGHPFWEAKDPQEKQQQLIHLLKNAGLVGGLLIAAADTEGRPSVGWRTRHAAEKASKQAHKATGKAGKRAHKASKQIQSTAASARGALPV
ncbi:DoxX family membrane protein [Amycolatopsis endophytica]|uniref:Putative membrane protein YphA (DoxX/SURF4 family) n=1 Tax=Amycolatopsis endophytica TaxID=860233 RepID=A0A853B0H3_9PSEU|nr:DoxX family protein [Amycolatopsis endophytica]NYI88563.1 putative membrane protein YphA (DoxX/SURF4 family) [Amycolatopsis endophytica]